MTPKNKLGFIAGIFLAAGLIASLVFICKRAAPSLGKDPGGGTEYVVEQILPDPSRCRLCLIQWKSGVRKNQLWYNGSFLAEHTGPGEWTLNFRLYRSLPAFWAHAADSIILAAALGNRADSLDN